MSTNKRLIAKIGGRDVFSGNALAHPAVFPSRFTYIAAFVTYVVHGQWRQH